VAPVGWESFDGLDQARTRALSIMERDSGVDLRVVLVERPVGEDIDVEAVVPSVASLKVWCAGAALPGRSRHGPVVRRAGRQEAACEAVSGMRVILDQLVERGEVSRGDAARLVAALAAAIMRSASANAA
jgi:hypothetical protein